MNYRRDPDWFFDLVFGSEGNQAWVRERRWLSGVSVTVDLSSPPERLRDQIDRAAAEVQATSEFRFPLDFLDSPGRATPLKPMRG